MRYEPQSEPEVDTLLAEWGGGEKEPEPDPQSITAIEQVPRLEDIDTAGIKWVAEGLIAEGAVHLLTGEAGCGKSTLVSAAGFSISQGLPFLGRPTSKRPVLMLDAENPVSVVRERFERLGIHSSDTFRIWGQWVGQDPPSAGSAVVLEWVARCQPKPVVIVDSLIAFHPGAENDSNETRKYLSQYRRLASLGGTAFLLHHPGKSETSKDYRGSSDIKAAIDLAYKLTNLGDGSQLSALELRAFKQRFTATPHLFIRYQDGLFIAEGCTASKGVTERLVDLLTENPGVKGSDFEQLAVDRGLGRNRARDFLKDGAKGGTVRVERGSDNRRLHYWRGGPALDFGDGEAAA